MSKADKLKELFGLDSSTVNGYALEEETVYPETTPGRILHIDGDFLAYQVAADDSKSLDSMMHNHDVAVETLRLLAGAASTVSHLTASHGDKGGRYDQAVQREYQGNRKDKVKPKHLHTIKSWMELKRGAVNHVEQEADDGLCQANWQAVQAGDPQLSVLVSKDKDLQMCQGVHLDWDTGELELVEGFGYVELDRSKSSPKIVGKGNAYFWAQMLTGDTADHIAGLPTLPGSVLNAIKPTKSILAAQERLRDPKSTPKQREKAKQTLANRKSGRCGAVMAYEIMKKVRTDKQAFQLVKTLYERHGQDVGFTHWSTEEAVEWNKVFLSEAQLLWMRRSKDHNDVLNYFKECK